jgi:hypothetical protein
LKVVPGDHVVEKEIEKHLRLRLLESLELRDEFTIEKETFLPRYWMNPNQRVDGLDGILPNQAAVHPGMSNHHGGAVDRLQAI